jgi:hypothetical protein
MIGALVLRLQRNGERCIVAGFQPCADDGPTGGNPLWPAMTLEKRLAILSGRLVCQNFLQPLFSGFSHNIMKINDFCAAL